MNRLNGPLANSRNGASLQLEPGAQALARPLGSSAMALSARTGRGCQWPAALLRTSQLLSEGVLLKPARTLHHL
jgi:hypothetical protein